MSTLEVKEIDLITTPQIRRNFTRSLKQGRVDSVMCFDQEKTSTASQNFSDIEKMRKTIGTPAKRILLVDLGVGPTGDQCLQIQSHLNTEPERIVIVDIMQDYLRSAAEHILSKRDIPVTIIHADFLRQQEEIRDALPSNRSKIYTCLGCTAGNFPDALHELRKLLGKSDQLLLGLGMLPKGPPEEVQEHISRLRREYSAWENASGGLGWIKEFSVSPENTEAVNDGKLLSTTVHDEGEHGTKVIRVYYEFPVETTLKVGGETVTFKEGKKVQFIETRRYDPAGVFHHLLEQGYKLVESQNLGDHTLFLCERGEKGPKRAQETKYEPGPTQPDEPGTGGKEKEEERKSWLRFIPWWGSKKSRKGT